MKQKQKYLLVGMPTDLYERLRKAAFKEKVFMADIVRKALAKDLIFRHSLTKEVFAKKGKK